MVWGVRAGAVVLAFGLWACGAAGTTTSNAGGSSSGGPTGGGPGITVGQGGSAYVPLMDHDAVELVHGPQGGWHVELTARFWGLNPEGLLLSYEVTPLDGATPTTFPARYMLTRQRVVPDGNGYVRLGDRAVFDVTDTCNVVGRSFTVRVTAQDVDGVMAQDARIVDVVDNAP